MTEAPKVLGADGADVDWVKVFLGFGGMVIGQFMAMLDIQIVASSLVQIQSGVGATNDEISWVQTIYLLAEVVVMPLTAYLTKMWGTRPFYVVACIGFMISSVGTGLCTTISSMILLRAIQGVFAGAMIPPIFATAMTIFPPERRLTANVLVGLIVTLAPTVGPTLGGHLTDLLSWRWLFFINVPVGFLVIFLVGRYATFDKGDPSLSKGIDWWGVGLMTVFLLSMQYVLEEGADESWFRSDVILWLSVTTVITGVTFIWRQLTYWQPIVSLKPFRDPNFALGATMTFVTGISLFGGTFLLPIFLGQVRGFSSSQIGETMLISGLVMFMSAPIGGRLVRMMDARIAMVLGFGLAAWSMQLGVGITADWGFWEFAVMQAARSLGTMVAMIASQQMSVSTLPVTQMKDASALINVLRNVGGAIGLAGLSTILGYQSAVHYTELAAGLSQANVAGQSMYAGLVEMMTAGGLADPEGAARKALSGMLRREALVLSFGDAFAAMAVGCWAVVVLALFARPGPAIPPAPGGGH